VRDNYHDMSAFAAPREQRYFEDYVPGNVHDCGQLQVSAADIVEFASRFDPQPMHVDASAAAASEFGGLIASGWHTAALVMRLYVEHYLPGAASKASPGVDEVRWPNPVRPGDTLHVQVFVLEAIPSPRRADRGVVRARIEARNQDGALVLRLTAMSILTKRDGETADG
jgi:acyl dehydratase